MSSPLRPYQEEALRCALQEFASVRSTLLVLATGVGKTVIFSHAAKHYAAGGVLVLESDQELVEQTAREVKRWTERDTGIEMAERSCSARIGRVPIVVASVPSLRRPARLEAYEPEAFSLIIIDEAHHSLAAGYRAVLDRFPTAKVLGVTATPDRHDRQALGQVFESVAYSFTLEDAIRGGWLAPIRQTRVVVDSFDFSGVRTTAEGDLNGEDLARILMEEQHLHAVAGPILEHAGTRPTLVFAASVDHAHQLAAVMRRMRPGCADSIDGTANQERRRDALARFRARKTQFLVNCNMYREGFDEPSISCVALARPTESRVLCAQMIGRGTRLSPATGKTDLLVLDFVGNAGKHQLVSAMDILGGDLEPRVRQVAQAAADQGLPLLEALAQARAQVEAEEKQRRDRAIAEEQRRGVVGKVQSHLVDVVSDPFLFHDFDPLTARRNGADVTSKQAAFLSKCDVPDEKRAELDRAQASEFLTKVTLRINGGLCTRRQARILAGYEVDARAMSFASAAKLIAAFKRNGWKKTSSSPRKSSPRKSGPRKSGPRKSSPRKSSPRSPKWWH